MTYLELLNQDGGLLFITFVGIIAIAIVIRAISSDVADVKEAKYNSYHRSVAEALAQAADCELGTKSGPSVYSDGSFSSEESTLPHKGHKSFGGTDG